MSSNIRVPEMPEPVGIFGAREIANRDAQWLEMYGPVVEAAAKVMARHEKEIAGRFCSEYIELAALRKAFAALSAITEPAPQRPRSMPKLGQQTPHLDAEDPWLSGDDMMGSSG